MQHGITEAQWWIEQRRTINGAPGVSDFLGALARRSGWCDEHSRSTPDLAALAAAVYQAVGLPVPQRLGRWYLYMGESDQ